MPAAVNWGPPVLWNMVRSRGPCQKPERSGLLPAVRGVAFPDEVFEAGLVCAFAVLAFAGFDKMTVANVPAAKDEIRSRFIETIVALCSLW